MSPSSTSTRSPATSRAAAAKRGSTSATTRASGSRSSSAFTSRFPMKPGKPVKKIRPLGTARQSRRQSAVGRSAHQALALSLVRLLGEPRLRDRIGLVLLLQTRADPREHENRAQRVDADRKYQEPPAAGGERDDRADHDRHAEREKD